MTAISKKGKGCATHSAALCEDGPVQLYPLQISFAVVDLADSLLAATVSELGNVHLSQDAKMAGTHFDSTSEASAWPMEATAKFISGDVP